MEEGSRTRNDSDRQALVSSGTSGWAGGALILTAVVAIAAKVSGVIVAPGARGVATEAIVNSIDTAAGAFAYTLAALLIALICGASFELARARSVSVGARGSVVAISGLIVALASPAVVERLGTLPSVALAVVTSIIGLVAGIVVLRTAETRAIGGVLALLAVGGLLRIVAWETSAVGFDRGSYPIQEVARGFATAVVSLQAIASLLAAAWIGTRSKWRGRVLANAAIVAAFIVTWIAARATDTPSAVESVLRTSLGASSGLPPPYLLGSIAAFLVPASLFLSIVALVQRDQPPALVAALVLALLSQGAFDVPLHALLATASAQWAMLAMTDERTVRSRRKSPANERTAPDADGAAPSES